MPSIFANTSFTHTSSGTASSRPMMPNSHQNTISARIRISGDSAMRRPRTTGVRLWPSRDRKSVVEGQSVSVRVDLGGRRINKKNIGDHRNKRYDAGQKYSKSITPSTAATQLCYKV